MTIVGITFGCIIVVATILGVCIKVQKQRTTSNQRTISSRTNQNSQAQIYPMTNVNRNAPGTNGNQNPYAISVSPMYTEEAPPSYDAFMAAGGVRE